MEREQFGRIVRQAWIDYCIETGHTDKPDRIAPWEQMDEWSQEVDRRIGEAVANRPCVWTRLSEVDWETSCGHLAEDDGDLLPEDADIHYCFYCGGLVIEGAVEPTAHVA